MLKISQYMIIDATDHWGLQSQVNSQVQAGWQPHGNPVVVEIFGTVRFYQAMVQYSGFHQFG